MSLDKYKQYEGIGTDQENPIKLPKFKVQKVQSQPKEHIPLGVKMVNPMSLWKKGIKGKNTTVAVIDTGVDYNHPDLKHNIIGGKDFTGSGDFLDKNGHGTHVAGTIAATDKGYGIVGVAPEAKILALKSLSDQGYGQIDWTLSALRYAIDQKVDVINMSLGGPHSPQLYKLVKEAYDKGIVVVAAAGNDGDGIIFTPEISFPGFYEETVQVGAVDYNGRVAYFSNTNHRIDVWAPGVSILSTYTNGKYAVLDGTSMAAPHVSAALALLLGVYK